MATHYPKLIIISGPEEGKEFELSGKDLFLIGRSDDNDIVLDDTSLSRRHASIAYNNNQWFIQDDGSRNGTLLNDAQIASATAHTLSHLDTLKIGIYEIRFAMQEFTEDDVKKYRPATPAQTTQQKPLETQNTTTTPQEKTTAPEIEEEDLEEHFETNQDELRLDRQSTHHDDNHDAKHKTGKSLLIFTIIALFFCIIGLIIFFSYNHLHKKTADLDTSIDTEQTETVAEEALEEKEPDNQDNEPTPEATTKPESETTPADTQTDNTATSPEPEPTTEFSPIDASTPDTSQQLLKEFTVILDIKTEPLPATIYFQDLRLCVAPCRQNISVKANETYTIYADYDLREVNDIFRKKVTFKVKPNMDVVELKIDAELGSLKVMRLPQRIDFYLEGYYEYDKLHAKPAKIYDLTYGKPIFLPYGKYLVELREKTKIAGSDNEITQIRFQREYEINKENRTINLQVTDKDLQFFPAVIKSIPPNADVYYGNELMGQTPYTGMLPLGPSQIKISKEGFFSSVVDIDMRMNSVYETTIELKTSKMGELINDAKEKIRNEQFQGALDLLVEALKFGGSAKEKAEVYFLLGSVYNTQKKHDQAVPYLERAKENTDFYHKASLALVRSYHGLKENIPALKLIVEVLANIDQETPVSVRSEANAVFKLLSPVKSVMYIYTDPPGSRVFINDKLIQQETPLILSDLGLGNYRIQIEKSGYKTYKTKQNIKIGEFILIKVRLNQEKL